MLTLRRQPYAKDDGFWLVSCDDMPIGVIVKPDLKEWHCSITIQANARARKNGKAETRAEALAELQAAWGRFSNEMGSEGWERHVARMEAQAERAKRW